ncbi:formimidoylglutamate deiminase [Microvirga rosea]|uniref:formimidoylglutamate deiminase n=1 Tax=Microvirga rosea TaxID=2715425 RepID=UPI001D0B4ACA|nr:formimidoylglutamate deiminase [Microvirga rosea]MCB8822152.1 formimidoylglutamate deiminase [Microvirga rosea]
MRRLFLDQALLPSGWARNVALDIDSGFIQSVTPDAPHRDGWERIAGIALPGLPNLHSHTFQRGMAGLAERRGPTGDSFWTWRQVMYRFLEHLTPDDVETVAAFAMMEMLEGGFTSLAEFHYLHHDRDGHAYGDIGELSGRIVAAAAEAGIGLTLLPVFYAQGGFGGAAPNDGQKRFICGVDAYVRLLESAKKAVRFVDDAVLGIAPHSLRAVTPESLHAVVGMAPEGPVHIHIAEQTKEVEDSLAWSGMRPVAWLLAHTPVNKRWCLIHATHLDEEEIQGLAASRSVAGLCPITEANLGDGIFPGVPFLSRSGAFGVGSDSNIHISAPEELRQLEYSQRLSHRGRNLFAEREGESTGRSLYTKALTGGAQALGRRVGALRAGSRADLVVLDSDAPDFAGLSGDALLDTYIFATGARAIDRVIVGGRTVVTHGRHYKRDEISARFAKVMTRIRS